MNSLTTEVHLVSGIDVPPRHLEAATVHVSGWLSDASPATLPKTPDTLLEEAAGDMGYFPMVDGIPVGYFTLQPFVDSKYTPVTDIDGRSFYAWADHFGLSSLVVAPSARGHGLGEWLVAEACRVAMGKVSLDPITYRTAAGRAALVSAVASPTSRNAFENQGFAPAVDSEVVESHRDLTSAQDSGKLVVSKAMHVTGWSAR